MGRSLFTQLFLPCKANLQAPCHLYQQHLQLLSLRSSSPRAQLSATPETSGRPVKVCGMNKYGFVCTDTQGCLWNPLPREIETGCRTEKCFYFYKNVCVRVCWEKVCDKSVFRGEWFVWEWRGRSGLPLVCFCIGTF